MQAERTASTWCTVSTLPTGAEDADTWRPHGRHSLHWEQSCSQSLLQQLNLRLTSQPDATLLAPPKPSKSPSKTQYIPCELCQLNVYTAKEKTVSWMKTISSLPTSCPVARLQWSPSATKHWWCSLWVVTTQFLTLHPQGLPPPSPSRWWPQGELWCAKFQRWFHSKALTPPPKDLTAQAWTSGAHYVAQRGPPSSTFSSPEREQRPAQAWGMVKALISHEADTRVY